MAALRGHLPAIRRDFGVRRIALFGSTVRDEAREDSDLDLLVDFEVGPTFDSFMGLKLWWPKPQGDPPQGRGMGGQGPQGSDDA